MKTGILGSGMMGQAISARLAELGHDANKLSDWHKNTDAQVKIGSFAETAEHGEMIFNSRSLGRDRRENGTQNLIRS